ncbi:MAG: hypothetical protein WCJ81_08520 [bacterium]
MREAKIGDTMLRLSVDEAKKSYDAWIDYTVPGFKKVKPYVYA